MADAEEDALALINATLRRITELTRMLHDSQSSKDAASIENELARLNGKRSELQLKHRPLAQLNARLQQWQDHLAPGAQIVDAKAPQAELRDGEDYPAAVGRLRNEIASLASERADVEVAGLPVSGIKEQMKRHVAERTTRGRPRVTASHDGFQVSFSRRRIV